MCAIGSCSTEGRYVEGTVLNEYGQRRNLPYRFDVKTQEGNYLLRVQKRVTPVKRIEKAIHPGTKVRFWLNSKGFGVNREIDVYSDNIDILEEVSKRK